MTDDTERLLITNRLITTFKPIAECILWMYEIAILFLRVTLGVF